ncbi:MAG: SusC/RagA family TonB-linked outer membrane protein [Gemmatimonadales bacterium]
MSHASVVRGLIGTLVALSTFGAPLAAQQGTVTGRVTDSASKLPLPGSSIQVSQTGVVVAVRGDGRYTITGVSPGTYDLRVIAIGYAAQRKTVAVRANATTALDFMLVAVPYTLEELVTTATGVQRRLEIGNSVAEIRPDSLTQTQPISSMTDLLQARTAGISVLPSSGTIGAGTRVRIRGANSLSLSNEPIIYVDGVKVNTDASSSSLGTGGQAPSRLNDINPDDLESVEIVKGPSAATLYGTQAANGVIRITTKHGIAGAPRWHAYVEGGYITDPNNYPNNYREVGQTITGGTPGGALRTCLLTQFASGVCTQQKLLTSNILKDPRLTPVSGGNSALYGADVTGGTESIQYFVSGQYQNQVGTLALPDTEANRLLKSRGVTSLPQNVLRPNSDRDISFRSNLTAQLNPNTDLQTNLGYTSGKLLLPQNDNNVLGILPSGYFGTTDTLGTPGWGFFAPGEIFSLLRQQNIERFTGSSQLNWRPLEWLAGRATVGYDVGQRLETSFDPTGLGPAFGTTPLGNKTDTRTELKTYTADAGLTAHNRVTHDVNLRSSVGVHYGQDLFYQSQAQGSRLIFGSDDIDGAAILNASQTTTTTITVGAYAEEQVTFKNRYFLTGALRVDDNSSFGQQFKAIVFPEANASWVVSDEPSFPNHFPISLLRLRAAYGQSGLQPGALDALTYLTPTTSAIAGVSTSAVAFGGLGLSNLKPERSGEFETGIDLGLFHGQTNVDFTFFDKKTTDALIARILAPSLGVSTSRFENLGSVSNKGFELTVNTRIINTRDLAWDMTLAGSTIKNRLLSLGAGVPPIISGVQRHVVGYPLGGFWDRPIKAFADANHDGIIEPNEIVIGDTAEFRGSSQPTRQLSMNQSFSVFHGRIRLSGLVDYQGGFYQYNSTEEFRCTSTGNNCRAIMDKTTPLAEQATAVARRFDPSATEWGYIEKADFAKLREVSLTYYMPDAWAHAFRSQHASISVAGRNLHTWTNYTGVDPELNQLGQTSLNGFGVRDFLTQPPVRTFIVRANFTF